MASTSNNQLSQVVVVLGSQWGDEGKGKIVDVLAQEYDVCGRFNGGSNAGHTIFVNDVKFAFHLMPSGILNPTMECIIGNGCVVHLPTLFKELQQLDDKKVKYEGRLFISDRAHLVFDFHQTIDGLNELSLGESKIGTTRKGIGPAYIEKMNRSGIRVGDLSSPDFPDKLKRIVLTAQSRFHFEYNLDEETKKYAEYAQKIAPYVVDSVDFINQKYKEGKKILLEGANAAMLDIDFGTYPYVTSSNPTIGGCVTGLGLSPKKIGDVIGVVKAYTTRVGEGPFPTELSYENTPQGKALRDVGREFGTTTGRPRRCGWLDTVVLNYTNLLNGYTSINLTKLDILTGFDTLKIGYQYKYNGKALTSMPSSLDVLSHVEVQYEELPGWKEDISKIEKFEDLPKNCQNYVNRIEELLNVPIKWIGVGAGRHSLISK